MRRAALVVIRLIALLVLTVCIAVPCGLAIGFGWIAQGCLWLGSLLPRAAERIFR